MSFKRVMFLGLVLFFTSNFGKSQDALSISQQMFANVKSIKSIQYTLESKERLLHGKFHTELSFFKINMNPYKLYLYQYIPKNGLQCIYVSGKNNGKCKVSPNSFPWVNLNMDPLGDLMLQDRHHSIFDAGLLYTASVLEYLLTKYHDQEEKIIKYNGIIKLMGTDCYYLTLTNPNYKLVTYITQANETPISIAKKNHLNFYSILDNNPALKGNQPIKPGTKLIIPNDYASKMELMIDKSNFYPVYLKIMDNLGVYEEYTYKQVIVNKDYNESDFSETNPAYKF